MRLLVYFAFLAVPVAGCASKLYRETHEGKFSGTLDVRVGGVLATPTPGQPQFGVKPHPSNE
jgi:hypothetical protein